MRVIVIGLGDVGQHIARTLSRERHDVTIVDVDADRVEAMQGELDALLVAGDGASPAFLRRLGVGDADLLCGVTQSDPVNVIAALVARQLGARQTVARVRDSHYFGDDPSFARDQLGIDFVINPERATAEDLAEAILLPGAVHVEYFADGKVAVAESILTHRSPLVGQPIGSRRVVRPSLVIGLIRDGRALAAEAGHRPKIGDHVLVAAAREHIEPVVAHVAGHASRVRDVIVFGGGRIGTRLATILERTAMRVTILEREAERARRVAEQLGGALVLHEEGLSRDALLQSGVGDADAFIASAGDDRANLLAALNAKRLGADLCMSVVSREEFVPLVDALEIDAAFSPRLITAEAILRFVHTRALRAMHFLRTGFEALELEVEEGALIVGRELGRTGGMLSGCRVGAILRGDDVLIPHVGSELNAGDRVLMLGVDGTLADVEPVFTARS